jgi:hypothetical protein
MLNNEMVLVINGIMLRRYVLQGNVIHSVSRNLYILLVAIARLAEEVSNRKFLRPAISTHVFLGFPGS